MRILLDTITTMMVILPMGRITISHKGVHFASTIYSYSKYGAVPRGFEVETTKFPSNGFVDAFTDLLFDINA